MYNMKVYFQKRKILKITLLVHNPLNYPKSVGVKHFKNSIKIFLSLFTITRHNLVVHFYRKSTEMR